MAGELSMGNVPGRSGSSSSSAANARWVNIGGMHILFSYGTPVAYARNDARARRESISATTSRHLSRIGASDWPIQEQDEFERELEEQLFAELSGRPNNQKNLFDLAQWLQRIDDVKWRRVTKLREAVGILTMEALRLLTVSRREPSEFDAVLLQTLSEVLAEEARHQEGIAAKAK